MIDKQQIEELDIAIRNIVKNNFVKVPNYGKYGGYLCDTDISTSSIATALYNVNYRKVPEGAVVVDKEYLKKELQGLELQARNETAKEIFGEIYKLLNSIKKQDYEDSVPYYCVDVEEFDDKLYILAKQYGVEVE